MAQAHPRVDPGDVVLRKKAQGKQTGEISLRKV